MKCPYCAEEIQDEARFCRHCRQDLALVLDLMRENEQLRDRMSSLKDEIGTTPASADSPHSERETSSGVLPPPSGPRDGFVSWWHSLSVVVLAAAFMIVVGAGIVYAGPRNGTEVVSTLITVAVSFFSGLLVGIRISRRHLRAYALLGILLGVLTGLGLSIVTMLSEEHLQGLPPSYYFTYAVGVMGLSPLVTTPLFVSGGWFGYLINRFRSSSRVEQATASEQQITTRVVGQEEPNKTTLLLIQSLGPATLALIGTTITVITTLLKP
jgi:hypothetical protein